MSPIVAIGGGNLRKRSTLPIDKEIVRLTGKKHPTFLFIPTATGDSERYWGFMHDYYTKYLRCRCDVLKLIKNPPAKRDIERKILSSDIVYVGGGNTLMMMRRWRHLGVNRMLKQAHKKGIVLCGVSAGSICWFDSGHSDSMSFYNSKKWKYINVKGLGLIPGIHCPHFDSATNGVKRRKNFENMIKQIGGMGIALEDDCALVVEGKRWRVLKAKPRAKAYRVFRQRGVVKTEAMA